MAENEPSQPESHTHDNTQPRLQTEHLEGTIPQTFRGPLQQPLQPDEQQAQPQHDPLHGSQVAPPPPKQLGSILDNSRPSNSMTNLPNMRLSGDPHSASYASSDMQLSSVTKIQGGDVTLPPLSGTDQAMSLGSSSLPYSAQMSNMGQYHAPQMPLPYSNSVGPAGQMGQDHMAGQVGAMSMPMQQHGMVQEMHGMHPMANIGMPHIPDFELKPAQLSMHELQRELTARGIVYTEDDHVTNVGRLIAYLIDQKQAGDSDLSSDSSEESEDDFGDKEDHTFAFLEVLLVSYGQQKKPLLDWLHNWQKNAEEFNRVEITELEESSLIKIRIWNNTSEPSGLVEQLNSVNIKCARYYCYTRGLVWGGWEFYENGQLQKQEGYNAENQPPLFWKRLCWVENADVDLTIFDKYNNVLPFPSKQVSRMFGTDEEMLCSSCGNTQDICVKVHGTFKGYFESKDLFDRHMSVVMQ